MKKQLLVIFAAIILGGCAHVPQIKSTHEAVEFLRGYSPQQVLARLGAPTKKEAINDMEIWTYEKTYQSPMGQRGLLTGRLRADHYTTTYETITVIFKMDRVVEASQEIKFSE